jgi:hypothetical protein
MNLTWFFRRFKNELKGNFTKADLLQCMGILSAKHLFDLICEVCLGYVIDAKSKAADCILKLRDEESALEKIIADNASDR